MLKNKYDRILERFENYYPDLYSQTVDWWPSSRMCITVKLDDGMLFEFDSSVNTIRRIRPTNYNKESDLLKKDIGNNLQKIVSARSMSQSEIASKAGITEAMLSRYIHGTSMPGVDKVYGLAAALGCRVVDILGEAYEEYDT